METSWTNAREMHQRILWARISRTEFSRPTDAARSLGLRPGTYRTYELAKEDGGRAPPLYEIQRIAEKFKVSWQWLATGDGTPFDAPRNELRDAAGRLASGLSDVPEDKRDDAVKAAEAVIASFRRTA